MLIKTTKVSDITKELESFLIEESNQFLTQSYEAIRANTPVDTGTAQRGWTIVSKIDKIGDTGTYENRVPYVIYLEEGHSGQAPYGFINMSLTRELNERK